MNGKSFVYVFAVLCAVIGGGVFVATQLAAPPVDKEELIKEVLAGEDLTAMANPFEKPANGPFGKAEILHLVRLREMGVSC
ncbi:MAG: hypothetical protein R3C01_14405 [Planctomycetaceae bacterium]